MTEKEYMDLFGIAPDQIEEFEKYRFINEMERQYLNEMFISYAKSKKTKDIKDTEYLKIKENING